MTKIGHVILSEAKNLGLASEILRFAQNDMPGAEKDRTGAEKDRTDFDW